MSVPGADRFYFGTVLLERNRWAKGERTPTIAVSSWGRRIAEAGFDGLELWQNHALLASAAEQEALRLSPAPVALFNSYASCENGAQAGRERAAERALFFGAGGMKFNFGADPARHDEYAANARAWRARLPPAFRFLCECHPGTTLEKPAAAAATFARLGRGDYEVILHAFSGDDAEVRGWFEAHGDRITHIHADISRLERLPADAVRRRADLLRALGFRGTLTVEFTEGVGAPDENPETLFRRAVRDLGVLRQALGAA